MSATIDLARVLHSAQKSAARAFRTWHLAGDRDVTLFEGFPLADIFRFDLAIQLADFFRQAALGREPAVGGFMTDDAGAQKFAPLPDFSMAWRRTDWKARAFRGIYSAARLALPARKRSVLVIGASGNRALWPYWLSRRQDLDLTLDFALSRPPGAANALKSLLHGARMFDPSPVALNAAQSHKLIEMRAAIEALPGLAGWQDLFTCEGRNFAEVFRRELLTPFAARLEGMAAKCLAFEEEFLRQKPGLILLPEESSSYARLLKVLGKNHGVPVWILSHGFGVVGYTTDGLLTAGDLDVDRVLAWGKIDKQNYIDAGIPEQHLDVAGSAAFDALLPLAAPRPLQGVRGASILVLAQMRIWSSTLYYDGVEERQFLEVAGLLRRLGAKKILFKIHPGLARLEFFRELERRLPPGCPIEFYKDESYLEVLAAADAVVGPASTAVFETLLSGKDYYIVHYHPHDIPPPLATANPFVARDIGALERNLLESRPVPREKTLRDFCGIDGTEQAGHFSRILFERLSSALNSG